MTYTREEIEELAEEYYDHFGDVTCYCSATPMPPCSACTHPGHPISVEIMLDELSQEEAAKGCISDITKRMCS